MRRLRSLVAVVVCTYGVVLAIDHLIAGHGGMALVILLAFSALAALVAPDIP